MVSVPGSRGLPRYTGKRSSTGPSPPPGRQTQPTLFLHVPILPTRRLGTDGPTGTKEGFRDGESVEGRTRHLVLTVSGLGPYPSVPLVSTNPSVREGRSRKDEDENGHYGRTDEDISWRLECSSAVPVETRAVLFGSRGDSSAPLRFPRNESLVDRRLRPGELQTSLVDSLTAPRRPSRSGLEEGSPSLTGLCHRPTQVG